MKSGLLNIKVWSVWLLVVILFGLTTLARAETDISARVLQEKGRYGFDLIAKQSFWDVSVKNISPYVLHTPIKVVVESVTPVNPSSSVTVANADGFTPEGKPYFLYTTTDGRLLPGTSIAAKRWKFANPKAVKFSYITRVVCENNVPIAQAGTDRTVTRFDTVTLDASGSSDQDHDSLGYHWSFVSQPSGSSAVLSDPATANPSFVADMTGDYVLQLVVRDAFSSSLPDQVVITATPLQVQVPNVSGLSQAEAELTLLAASLAIGPVSFGNHDTVPEHGVISQEPLPGVSVVESTPVSLTISLGPAHPVPILTLQATPEYVRKGVASVLSWSAANADSVSIEGMGVVPANGSVVVAPSQSMSYNFTATGPGGTVSKEVTVQFLDYTAAGASAATVGPEHKLVPSDSASYDSFGNTVATNGQIVLASAPGKNNYSGVVYSFVRGSQGWEEHGKLIPSVVTQYGNFGQALAIDGLTAVIGAVDSAYVFTWDGATWSEQARLVPSVDGTGFGESVAISGDHILIGAPNEDQIGAVYVFKNAAGIWTAEARLSLENANYYASFGTAVAVDGNTAIVGAPNLNQNGAAIVFRFDGYSWAMQTQLVAAEGAYGDWFGGSVALDGNHATVAAPGRDGSGNWSGAVYVFAFNGMAWQEQAKAVPDNGVAYDNYFGSALGASNDMMIAGAPWESMNDQWSTSWSGAVYLHQVSGSTLARAARIVASDSSNYAEFGKSVALHSGVFVAGAPGDGHDGLYNAGAVYAYDVTTASISVSPDYTPDGKAVLTWKTGNADSVHIDQRIGLVAASGSVEVTVTGPTKYTITASGPGGAVTASAILIPGPRPPAVRINAKPSTIDIGTATTLNWEVENADSLVIDQGIGIVSANGSIVVSPTKTMTYTLTATGPGGVVSKSETVTVLEPPTVAIWADHQMVPASGIVTLTWQSTGVAQVSIWPGIGYVAANGSIEVRPTEATTYEIWAGNSLGTATSRVTISFPPPIVQFRLDREKVQPGGIATLSWNVTNAYAVVIDLLGAGQPLSGSTVISPLESTSYTLTATGPGGVVRKTVTIFCVDATGLGILIHSPADGATVGGPYIDVEGEVIGAATEIGVVVNGIHARLIGNRFYAEFVPLVEGENIIKATITDASGHTITDTVTVFRDSSVPAKWIKLSINPEAGIVPFTTVLTADPRLANPIDSTSAACDGPDMAVVVLLSDTEYELTILTPGTYTCTYNVVDTMGNHHEQRITITAFDKTALNSLLVAKWDGVKSAWNGRDVEGGLFYFLESSRENYRGALNAIVAELPMIMSEVQDVEMVYARGNRVKYRTNRRQIIEGTSITLTYYIYFVKDQNGIWKIEQF